MRYLEQMPSWLQLTLLFVPRVVFVLAKVVY